MKANLKTKSRRGFTLVELMVVVLIIAILAALVVPKFQDAKERANDGAAKSQIGRISAIIQQFRLDCDRYPTTEEGLNALVTAPADATGWRGPYLDRIPPDPWQQEYVYVSPGLNSEDSFRLSTNGRDKQAGTADDIANTDL